MKIESLHLLNKIGRSQRIMLIMNQDEGFHRRWELRRGNVDEDSSSDDDEGSKKIVTDLVLFENDEACNDDDTRSHDHVDEKLHIPSGIGTKNVKADEEKKLKPSKKKRVATKKKLHRVNEKKMSKDLKIFADSLVRELAAAQESMFARMRDEMRELVASESNKKNGRRLEKKVCAKIGTSHLQDQRNSINLINDHFPFMDSHSSSASRVEFCKLMAQEKSLSHRFAELKQHEQYGGFSLNYHKAWGLYGESRGIGFPAPLHQGTVNGSSRSSLSFLTDKGIPVSRFPSTIRASSERMVGNVLISSVSRFTEGEFKQALKGTK
ncbi:uncharacterized protein LOC131015671 [Salvia miltiorrhiza]|uniref:uncharacterized protein LOC131015671 n=1 Tax=Salvia miltiorrhiza TaxID=226208 RepID=UPI0025ABD919|nr:uncharacterized protein LOC131015671 [Salvia miltiorrhiza]